MYQNSDKKKLYLFIEITQLLYKYKCTYQDTENIISLLSDEIKQQRDELEYNDIDDYVIKRKTYFADNDIIKPLNHVEQYC